MEMKDPYRPLDMSKSEIRLLSFDTRDGPIRLSLHHVSLDDLKPEYISFRDQHATMGSYHLSQAWSDRFEFTLATPKREIYDAITRFTWGDYTCLSYTWGDSGEDTGTILLDGISMSVTKHLEAAMKDLRESSECSLGMKVWVDALCINPADDVDWNSHVLRVKDIFGEAFSVRVWTKDRDDLQVLGLEQPGEWLRLCEHVLREHGKQVLEELLGIREREWGAAESEDEQLRRLVEDIEFLVFDDQYWADSDEEDELGSGNLHLRDIVSTELMQLFQKTYWSRLWIVQELAVSPTTSVVYWGESTFYLSTLQVVCEIVSAQPASGQSLNLGLLQILQPRLDLLAFISTWRKLASSPASTGRSLDDTSIQQLNLLAQHATCSLPQDQVYGLLGLFPSSVSNTVTIDYNLEPAEVMAEFYSAVPGWTFQSVA
ncbi:hypothetical protein diail_4784 [Diaporthe ilicicola]|nr:hypothetical protein diail_4784 [Diaporthe ilicicola]